MKRTLASIRRAWIEHNSPLFKTGLALLIINPLIGWIGAPVVAAIITVRYEPRQGIIAAGIIYLFSWILLGAGVFLAGKPGYRISRQIFRNISRRLKRRTINSVKKHPPGTMN